MDARKAKLASAALVVGLCSAGLGTGAENAVVKTAEYDLSLRLQIPRVYDNNKSLGYRKYQLQKIEGTMTLGFNAYGDIADISFSGFRNKTQKLSSGKDITYDVFLEKDAVWPCFAAVGSNKTKEFKTASIAFYIAAEPSYSVSPELTEDSGLYLMLSGKGLIDSVKGSGLKSASGQAAGKMGCGCAAYGHVSPTRMLGKHGAVLSQVTDIAAAYGTWKLKRKR